VDGGAPKFPLGLLVEESEDGYRVLLEHHARLLGADGAERLERAFVAVLEQLATDPSAPVVTLARAVSPARARGRRMSQTAAPE
jgi:predicted DNA-binding ribbon-helix-helix protein